MERAPARPAVRRWRSSLILRSANATGFAVAALRDTRLGRRDFRHPGGVHRLKGGVYCTRHSGSPWNRRHDPDRLPGARTILANPPLRLFPAVCSQASRRFSARSAGHSERRAGCWLRRAIILSSIHDRAQAARSEAAIGSYLPFPWAGPTHSKFAASSGLPVPL